MRANITKTILKSSLALVVFLMVSQNQALAKTKSVRKVQEVDFAEVDLKGTVRNPDGAYLVQKRGLKFMPLLDVQKDMDQKIRESAQFVR